MRVGWGRRLGGETVDFVEMECVRANLQDWVRWSATMDNKH